MRRNVYAVLAVLFISAAQSSPLTARKRPKPQTLPPASPTSSARDERPAQADYIIGPEDVLDISVWKEPDHSRVVTVRPDGKVSLPVLNDVQAAGRTAVQLAGDITERLKKYVSEPQVTVIVTTINSKRVYILGEVTRPGPTPLLPNMTVLQALSVAGGFTQFANPRKIYILRDENGRQQRIPFNYKQVIRGNAPSLNILLKPGDTIVVP